MRPTRRENNNTLSHPPYVITLSPSSANRHEQSIPEPTVRHKMKRAKRSGVWESFTLNKDGDEVTCNLCSQVIKYSSSTSTMKYHMSCKHAGAESTSSGSGVQQTLPSMITARRCDARKTEAITHKICRNCDGIGLMRLIALS